MKSPIPTIPRVCFDHEATPLDNYLLLIREIEQARRRMRWHSPKVSLYHIEEFIY